MDSARGARSWLKLGCLTVVGLIVLVVAWVAAVFGTAFVRARNETVAPLEVVREPPGRRSAAETGAAPRAPGGRVILDLTVGEFTIRGGHPGEPIRIDARYDTSSYRLTEKLETAADGSWVYRVLFEQTSWFKDDGLRAVFGGSYPNVEISLPPDVPIALEGRFAKGGTELDLGGMWLTEIDLTAEKGGLGLYFDEPLPVPLERFTLRARQGGTAVRRLGHASPRVIDVAHSQGGMSLDLGGDWVCDSDVTVYSSMGGGGIQLPRHVRVEGLDETLSTSRLRAEPEIPRPTLRMSVSSGMFGEVQVGQP